MHGRLAGSRDAASAQDDEAGSQDDCCVYARSETVDVLHVEVETSLPGEGVAASNLSEARDAGA